MKNKALLSTLILLTFVSFAYTDINVTSGTVASVYVKNPPTLIVDDFDDGVPPNNLGGGAGSFASTSPLGVADTQIVTDVNLGGSGCSVKVTYDVTETGSYSGYWTQFHSNGTRDLSDFKTLSFYVKGAAGGEFFKVELSTCPSNTTRWVSKIYINDYLDGGVTTDWQKVTIPLNAFWNVTDWTGIYEFTVVFEESNADKNGSPKTGTIYIDNIALGSEFLGVLRIDHFGDKVEINSLGGASGFMNGGVSIGTITYVTNQYMSYPNAVALDYEVDGGWVGYWSQFGGGFSGTVAQNGDLSDYDQLSLYVMADDSDFNPERLKLELEYGSNGKASCIINGISTDWQKFTVSLSNFSGLDKTSIKQWNFVPEPVSENVGRIRIDKVQFENSMYVADSTAPAVPSNLIVKDSASGRYVSNGSEFGWINWLTVEADNSIQDDTLESVRFEYKESPAGSWTTIGMDFDTSDDTYETYWDTTGLSESPATYELRAVAVDMSGNETPMDAYTGLEIIHYPDITSYSDDELLDWIQQQIFWYFWVEANPDKGIVQDRAKNFQQDTYGIVSVAATGMGLVAICTAHERGWISFADAYNRVNSILKTHFNAPDVDYVDNISLVRHNGFYYHFTNFGGARDGTCELSTIDTAIFIAGALFTGKYFKDLGYDTPWDYADQMYKRIDWKWMTDDDGYLQWGWTPEANFNQGIMNGYCESILAYILGAGSPESNKKLDATGWDKLERPTAEYKGLKYIFEQTLFTHQYPALFIDFSGKKDQFVCYAANTLLATLHQHLYAYDNREAFSTYGKHSWGLGATDMPGGGYIAYGIGENEDGTIAINNQLTAITERPKEVIDAIRYLYTNYATELFGKYSACDSYNTDNSQSSNFNETNMWRDPDVLGVQQGAVFAAIENYRSGLIKDTFSSISYIDDAFDTLEFVSDSVAPGKITDLELSQANGQMLLTWTASGDDGYSNSISSGIYEVRFATQSGYTWDTAPSNYLDYKLIWSTDVVAGQAQSKIIPGISGGITYRFWIRVADGAFNWSEVSDVVTIDLPDDIIPPADITNLDAVSELGCLRFTWTAPGDDGLEGDIAHGKYEIVYTTDISQSPDNAPYSVMWTTNTSPGASESRLITSLEPDSTYYFWIRTYDEYGANFSGFSNGVTYYILDPIPPSAVTDLTASIDFQVELTWSAPGNDGTSGTATAYILKYSTSVDFSDETEWNSDNAETYQQSWTPQAFGITETKILTGLYPGLFHYFSIRAVDVTGNKGGLSNSTAAASGFFKLHHGLHGKAFAFGDMDNDGDCDLAIGATYYTQIYNNISSSFTFVQQVNRGGSGVKWLDFDKDGYMDFVVIPGQPDTSDYQAHLYKSNNAASFTLFQSFARYDNTDSGLDVADYDNDGDVDIAFTGWGDANRTEFWRNDISTFTAMGNMGLDDVQNSNIAFADYDNDGDMDVALKGVIWRNDGGTFTNTGYGTECSNPSLAWGDYDNDGDLDLAVGADECNVYKNNGDGTFTALSLNITSSSDKYFASWGDYDNNGLLDVMLGHELYTNMGDTQPMDTFWKRQSVPGDRRAEWVDFNNDGALDFITSSGIYENLLDEFGTVNSAPQAPSEGFAVMLSSASMEFKWDISDYDVETSSNGLYYAIRIGTKSYSNPGDDNVISGNFGTPLLSNHLRSKLSSAQAGRSIHSSIVEGTMYYWQVKTIDPGLRQSSWSVEQSTFVASIEPHSVVLCPANGSIASSLSMISGTAWDNYYVGKVEVSIKSLSLDKYWDGASFDSGSELWHETQLGPHPDFTWTYTSITDDVLTIGTSYWVASRAHDLSGNIESSSVGSSTCTYNDSNVPGKVTGFVAQTGQQVDLTWVAPGDDDYTNNVAGGKWQINYSSDPADTADTADYSITLSSSWTQGITYNTTLTGLQLVTEYYFWIRAQDEVSGNWSVWSDTASLHLPIFIDIQAGLPGVRLSSLSWGDFDNDGDLDLALTGDTGDIYLGDYSHIYRNDNGTFTKHCSFTGVEEGKMEWGDYDNDGDLDIAICGGLQTWIYRNDNCGTFTKHMNLEAFQKGGLAWGDYDNDGDLDLALCGSNKSKIYRNDNYGTFTEQTSLAGVQYSSLAWGDYDNDGDLDIILAGEDIDPTLYRNDGGGIFTVYTTFWTVQTSWDHCYTKWGDFDNDGYLDLAISGDAPGSSSADTIIYRNNSGTFTTHAKTFPDKYDSSIDWGDYDNDGDLDIVIAGRESGTEGMTRIYRNDNGTFVFVNESLPGLAYSSVAWGDYDNDGAIDLAVSGTTDTVKITRIYKSMVSLSGNANSAPDAPVSGFSAAFSVSDPTLVEFRWEYGTDNGTGATPQEGLYYDIRMATETVSGDISSWIVSPSTGAGVCPSIGSYPHGFAVAPSTPGLNLIPIQEDVTCYWQVRAIDTGYKKSPWSDEQLIYIPPIPPAAITDLAGQMGTIVGRVDLTWTAQADNDVRYPIENGKYKIKYSSDSSHTWDDMPYETVWTTNTSYGTAESTAVTELSSGVTYYFYIKTQDEVADNWSDLSNKALVKTSTDTFAPAAITSLTALLVDSVDDTVKLQWNAPGDDGWEEQANHYKIKYTTNVPAGESDFNKTWKSNRTVGGASGYLETENLTGLIADTTYYFAVWTYDEILHKSDISNMAYCTPINVAPASITTLTALVGSSDNSARLQWNAPGDDGWDGQADYYAIKYTTNVPAGESDYDKTWKSNRPAGGASGYLETEDVTGLVADITHYFAVWAYDDVSTVSEISNTAYCDPVVIPPAAITTLTALKGDLINSVKLQWNAPGDDGLTGQVDHYLIKYTTNVPAGESDYNKTWKSDRPAGGAAGYSETETVTGLISHTTHYFAIWAYDETVSSEMSNTVSSLPAEWLIWDDLDSRSFAGEAWGGRAPSSLTWGNYHGRDCLRVEFAEGPQYYGCIRLDWVFDKENWRTSTDLNDFKCYAYVEHPADKVLLYAAFRNWTFNTKIEQKSGSPDELSVGAWHDITWDIDSTKTGYLAMASFSIDFYYINDSSAVIYIDDFRLVRDGVEELWDNMDDPSLKWKYSGDFYDWNKNRCSGRKEPISHNQTSAETPAGALYLEWDGSLTGDTFAKVENETVINEDWSGYSQVSIDVYCSDTSAKIKVDFWDADGSDYAKTSEQYVSTANTWETLIYNLPTPMDYTSIDSIGILIDDTGTSTGEIYIDNIRFK